MRAVLTPLVVLAAAVFAIVGAFRLVLRIPGIPYNVRDLFLDQASTTSLVFFALTLLWVGAGAMVVAETVAQTRRPYLWAPVALLLACLTSKILLSRSVTYESIDDIIGSNALYGMVTQGNAWGTSWARAFHAIGADTVDFFERRVRYSALYSIPLIGIATMLAACNRSVGLRIPREPLALFLVAVIASLWLWLARTIVVPWAGTDNLTELLPNQPVFGVDGEWYLFAITLLIGLSAALLLRAAHTRRLVPVAFVSTIAALPVGWVLLNLGLEQRVEKYGAVFSGVQFLLGPDRTHALSHSVLFSRWLALQLGAVSVTFIGAWIAARFFAAAARPTSGGSTAVAASSHPHASRAPDSP